jgi:hypothetical protein
MSTDIIFKAGGAEFLDPENVGSSVRWLVSAEVGKPSEQNPKGYSHMSGEVSLTDCSRTITWYLGEDSEDKLAKAIELLQQAKRGMRQAKRDLTKARTKLGITDER